MLERRHRMHRIDEERGEMNYLGVYHSNYPRSTRGICDAPCVSQGAHDAVRDGHGLAGTPARHGLRPHPRAGIAGLAAAPSAGFRNGRTDSGGLSGVGDGVPQADRGPGRVVRHGRRPRPDGSGARPHGRNSRVLRADAGRRDRVLRSSGLATQDGLRAAGGGRGGNVRAVRAGAGADAGTDAAARRAGAGAGLRADRRGRARARGGVFLAAR